MTDERIVEVMAKGIAADRGEYPPDSEFFDDARAGLAALRDAGFDVYRPDDCVDAVCYPTATGHVVSVRQRVPEGHYSLVPVGGDS